MFDIFFVIKKRQCVGQMCFYDIPIIIPSCWLTLEDNMLWAFVGPALLVIVVSIKTTGFKLRILAIHDHKISQKLTFLGY